MEVAERKKHKATKWSQEYHWPLQFDHERARIIVCLLEIIASQFGIAGTVEYDQGALENGSPINQPLLFHVSTSAVLKASMHI